MAAAEPDTPSDAPPQMDEIGWYVQPATGEPGNLLPRVSFRLPESAIESPTNQLVLWWVGTAMNDFLAGAPKVEEYGAHDLEIMGAVLFLLAYRERMSFLQEASKAPLGTELACWFYVLGKVARLVSDYLAERPGKADTWHDVTYYSMMARRIQETGRWP